MDTIDECMAMTRRCERHAKTCRFTVDAALWSEAAALWLQLATFPLLVPPAVGPDLTRLDAVTVPFP